MATTGPRAQKPVGSAAWIAAEKENVMNLVDQEMEEVEYPVRHEMEWLNEHMAEIFSSNQFNVTEIFKTPGKLRGKTPRTARKRNVDEARVPLSDIFSSNHQLKASANPGPLFTQPTKPAANNEVEKPQRPQDHKPNQNLNSFPKYNTDSGYHGMPDDEEDDVVLPGAQSESQSSTQPLEATQPSQATQPLETTQPSQDTQDTQPTQSLHDTQPLEEEPEEEPEAESEAEPEEEREAELEEGPEAEPEEEPEEELEEPEVEPEKEPTSAARNVTNPSPDRRRTSEGSFHSAQEDIRQREDAVEPMNVDSPARQKIEVQIPQPSQRPSKDPEPAQSPARSPEKTAPAEPAKSRPDEKESKNAETALDNQFDDIGSPSDNSTPERPLIRKSSLTFASLPAREPLNTKKSMGGTRISRTSHIDLGKMSAAGRPSYFGRQTGGPRTTQVVPEEDDEKKLDEDKMDVDDEKGLSHDDSDMDIEASKLHNKSSTQRLHEKISMLGKLQPSRPTKSIPAVSALASSQVTYPELPSTQQETSKQGTTGQRPRSTQSSKPAVGDDDEWIKPMSSPLKANLPKSHTTGRMDQPTSSSTGKDDLEKSRSIEDSPAKRHPEAKPSSLAALGHGKSASTPTLSSPQRPGTPSGPSDRNASAADVAVESTTPPVSPRRYEGPLSASRSKLQSIMKTARGLLTGSAGTPVPGRMEPSSPIASRSQPNHPQDNTASEHAESQPREPSSPLRQEGRRTRSSTEREEKRKEQELKDRQRMDEQLEKAREQERQKAAESKMHQEKPLQREDLEAAPATKSDSKNTSHSQKQPSREPEHRTPALPHYQQPQQTSKQNDRRPVKPTRETQQKPKPQPVSIRVGSTLSRQMPLSSTASSSVQDPAPAPTPASASKHPTISKKTSTSSLHTTASTSSFKSTISTQSQRKAQLAAERKREQEEREARRREEQKRELERKRAAQQQQQQEEARRQELRNRAEAERRERERERLAMEEAKKAAQKQAIEKRRLENARRHERQGSQQPNSANDSQDRTAPHSAQRNDLGPARPASRLGSVQPFSRSINQPPPNPAKPPKRVLEEDTNARSAASKPSTVYQAAEPKRRKTEDEHNPLPPIRPTMAPPIRQSNIRKVGPFKTSEKGRADTAQEPAKPAIFPYNCVPAPPPAAHHQTGSSLFKNPSASHHAQQPGSAQPQRPGHPMDMAKYTTGKIPFADASNSAQASAPHRTPGQSTQKAPVKESPRYPSGETIHLPEIPTDSEDEDSDAEMFPVPKWAQPKELEAILREQEGKETDSIFGPIAPFSLEETFKADKKAKKFRERTSSANWGGADGLTQEEIRKDIAERQRLRMNGGWTFTPQ